MVKVDVFLVRCKTMDYTVSADPFPCRIRDFRGECGVRAHRI
jgi:hypothetical protein